MTTSNLLFIDTNIWLDFYRASNETSLQLLSHTKAITDKVIVTHQLESEFKGNRQAAIIDGIRHLKAPDFTHRLGIFSDAKATKTIKRNLSDAKKHVEILQERLRRALEEPGTHDPVYKAFQQILNRKSDVSIGREDKRESLIRRHAFKRFLHGCPPRKRSDTSIGDAFNWEWMVHCAKQKGMGLVIVSRDADYGVTHRDKSYVNDHLKQEFGERVSRRRHLSLHTKLSEALKLFEVKVSPQEEQAEKELVSAISLKFEDTLAMSDSIANYMKGNYLKTMETLRPLELQSGLKLAELVPDLSISLQPSGLEALGTIFQQFAKEHISMSEMLATTFAQEFEKTRAASGLEPLGTIFAREFENTRVAFADALLNKKPKSEE